MWAEAHHRGTSLGYLPPLRKSSASLESVGWEVLGDQWHPTSHRSTAQQGTKGVPTDCVW